MFTEEIQEFDDKNDEMSNAFLAYFADENHEDKDPVYCKDLGLAIEDLKPGFSLQSLWEIIPKS